MSAKFSNGASGAQVDILANGAENKNDPSAKTPEIRWWQRVTLGQFTR